MKHIVVMIVAGSLLLISCSRKAEITGTWQGTDARLVPADSASIDTADWNASVRIHKATTFIFNSDSSFTGTVNLNGKTDENKAKWRLTDDGRKLILDFSKDFSNMADVDTLTFKRLVIRHSFPFGTVIMGFDKVK